MVDVVTELVMEGVLSKLLCVDDLVLMSRIIDGVCNKFRKWKEAFECRGVKVSRGEAKAVVSGSNGQWQ